MSAQPLGLMPRMLWTESRVDEILNAIKRYVDSGKSIPIEWREELEEHLAWIDMERNANGRKA